MVEEFRLRQQECIVYLEAYEKAGDGIVDAYIDFRQRKDLVLFSRATNFDSNSRATFIELCGLKSAKRLRRGCYYKLNLDFIKNYQISRNENSLIIGGSYYLGNMQMPKSDNEEVLQSQKIKGRFFDPFCNNIIRDKSRYNHICLDRRERNLVRVSTM